MKKQFGFTLVESLLVILVIAAIGLGGYFVWHSHHKTTKNVATISKTTISAAQMNALNVAWATFSSTTDGFSFKYPISDSWSTSGGSANSVSTQSPLDNSDTRIGISEIGGSGLSTDTSQFLIDIEVVPDAGSITQVPSFVTSGFINPYSEGTVTTLDNGLQIWHTKQSFTTDGSCSKPLAFYMVDNGNFYKRLANGKYLAFGASFCSAAVPANTEVPKYQQQVNSQELIMADVILSSMSFK